MAGDLHNAIEAHPSRLAEAAGTDASDFYRSEALRMLELAERCRFLDTKQTLVDTARLAEHAAQTGMQRA